MKLHKEQPDSEVTLDAVMSQVVIHGSANKVVDEILALREQTGDFGEIVYAGMDWVDPGLTKRSMQLMAEQVMPRINQAISGSTSKAAPVPRTVEERRRCRLLPFTIKSLIPKS